MEKQSNSDLQKILAEKKEDLRNFRFNSSGSKIKNVKEGQSTRKDIARILTELRKREINENVS